MLLPLLFHSNDEEDPDETITSRDCAPRLTYILSLDHTAIINDFKKNA